MNNETENRKNKLTKTYTLANWQQDFTHSLLSDLSPSLQESFATHSTIASEQRFSIYQNNVFHSLSNALADLYPVVKKLVGDDFFMGTASYYLRENPPQQAAMVYFGQDFSDFLRTFEHTRDMTYLADIAELELARQEAYHAADENTLTATGFAEITPDKLSVAHISLHSSLRLVRSNHPIFTIWQANQDDQALKENIDLSEPQQILVVRPTYELLMYSIDRGTYDFINALQSGSTLEQALEKALVSSPELDVSKTISFAVQTQLITRVLE